MAVCGLKKCSKCHFCNLIRSIIKTPFIHRLNRLANSINCHLYGPAPAQHPCAFVPARLCDYPARSQIQPGRHLTAPCHQLLIWHDHCTGIDYKIAYRVIALNVFAKSITRAKIRVKIARRIDYKQNDDTWTSFKLSQCFNCHCAQMVKPFCAPSVTANPKPQAYLYA
jgi:hypothetical protein